MVVSPLFGEAFEFLVLVHGTFGNSFVLISIVSGKPTVFFWSHHRKFKSVVLLSLSSGVHLSILGATKPDVVHCGVLFAAFPIVDHRGSLCRWLDGRGLVYSDDCVAARMDFGVLVVVAVVILSLRAGCVFFSCSQFHVTFEVVAVTHVSCPFGFKLF